MLNVYFQLLLKLIVMAQARLTENQIKETEKSIDLTQEDDKEDQQQLTSTEIFTYFLKQSLDREVPLINHIQLRSLLNVMNQFIEQQIINPITPIKTKNYLKQRAQLYELIETLCMFCGQARLQGMNTLLFGKLSEPLSGNTVNDTRDSSNSLNSLENLFHFLQNSSLFEDSILMIVKQELESLNKIHSIYSIEQTASYKLVTEIMKYLSSLSSNCPKVP